MAVCSHCGWESQSEDVFCQRCGMRLQSASAPAEEEALHAQGANGTINSSDAAAMQASAPPVVAAVATPIARVVVRSASAGETDGPIEEAEYVLDGRETSVGRSPSCDIALSGDQLVSRRHALLRFRHGNYTIVDLGSSNGTYINDAEIREEVVLHDGDVIKVGGHEILYSTAPAGPNASVAGARVSRGIPSAPLGETNPSIPSMSPLAEEQPQEAAGAVGGEPAPDIALQSVEERAPVEDVAQDTSLHALRSQLAEIDASLARHAEEDERANAHMRAALREVRDALAAISATPPPVPSGEDQNPRTSELVAIARQAAENPRHLDYVTDLAAHASEIADALEAKQTTALDDVRPRLEALRARIDDLLA